MGGGGRREEGRGLTRMNNEQMRDSVCTGGITDYGLRETDDGGDECIDVWTYGRMDGEWRIADNG